MPAPADRHHAIASGTSFLVLVNPSRSPSLSLSIFCWECCSCANAPEQHLHRKWLCCFPAGIELNYCIKHANPSLSDEIQSPTGRVGTIPCRPKCSLISAAAARDLHRAWLVPSPTSTDTRLATRKELFLGVKSDPVGRPDRIFCNFKHCEDTVPGTAAR